MKKIVSVLLAACLGMSLAACAGSSTAPATTAAPAATTAAPAATTAAPAAAAPAAAETTAAAAAAVDFPKMHIQLGHVNPTTDADQYHKFATLFTEKVTAKTNGAITFDILGNSELGGENEMLTGFDLGTHEVAIISNLALANQYGPSNVVEMPFEFASNEKAWAFLDSDIMQEVKDGLYKDKGWKVLAYGEGGFRNVLSQKAIRTPADIAAMKIRVPEARAFIATFEALGANPTPMAFAEVFTAVQQHVIDGLELPIASAYTGSYYEVCSHYDLTGHFYNAIGMVCSKSFWEGLSPELQEIFQTSAQEAAEEQRAWLQGAAEDMLKKMEEGGCTIVRDVDTEAFRNAAASVYDEYRDIIGGELLDKALDFLK